MKTIKCCIISLLIISTTPLLAQDCVDYHRIADCMLDRQRDFKIYSQSKSVGTSPLDTVEFNIVFYGQKDYICSFCTHGNLYPIHFVLLDSKSGDLLYDNAKDRYIESLGIGFDVTKSLTIRVDLLSRKATEEELQQYMGCLGLLIQYRNYATRKVDLQL